MDTAGTPPSGTSHALLSWWWVPVSALVYGAALAGGVAAKSFGPFTPELGMDIALSHGRNGLLIGLSQLINYGIGPAAAVALLLGICAWLLWGRGRPLQALTFGSVVSVGWLSSTIGKVVVNRSRPPADAVSALVTETRLDSFPSGHTAFASALMLAAVLVLARTKPQRLFGTVAGALFVALVAFSRLYLGVHYPSDVVGSVIVSAAAILAWLPVWNNLIAPRLGGAAIIRRLDRERLPAR